MIIQQINYLRIRRLMEIRDILLLFHLMRIFLEKFPSILRDSKSVFEAVGSLEAEFLRYQMAAIPEDIISLERPNSQWSKLSKFKDNEDKQLYGSLSNFMCKLLVFPHSNAA